MPSASPFCDNDAAAMTGIGAVSFGATAVLWPQGLSVLACPEGAQSPCMPGVYDSAVPTAYQRGNARRNVAFRLIWGCPPPSHGWGQDGSRFLLLYDSFIQSAPDGVHAVAVVD